MCIYDFMSASTWRGRCLTGMGCNLSDSMSYQHVPGVCSVQTCTVISIGVLAVKSLYKRIGWKISFRSIMVMVIHQSALYWIQYRQKMHVKQRIKYWIYYLGYHIQPLILSLQFLKGVTNAMCVYTHICTRMLICVLVVMLYTSRV